MTDGKTRFVSLLANWYSGATLFTILLNRHSQIVSNGESMFFSDQDTHRYDCSCGRFVDECDFYRQATNHMWVASAGGWDKSLFVQVPTFSRNRILRSFFQSWRFEGKLRNHVINAIPEYRTIRDRFLQAQLKFFANARRLAGAPIYLDGTKSVRRAQMFARHIPHDMKVLHLVRDGRAFCVSYQKYERSQPTLNQAANAWLSYIAQIDQFTAAFPLVPVLTTRYEDLCRSTAETLGTVCRFLEIPYEDLVSADTTEHTHILGNEMRKTFTGSIVESTSWREKLDRSTQLKLTSLMKNQLERFGYL
jgi:hypothetical protein